MIRLFFNIRDINTSLSDNEPWPAPSCSLGEVLGLGWGRQGVRGGKAEMQEGLLRATNPFNLHNMRAGGGVPLDRSGPEARRGEASSRSHRASGKGQAGGAGGWGVPARCDSRVRALCCLPTHLEAFSHLLPGAPISWDPIGRGPAPAHGQAESSGPVWPWPQAWPDDPAFQQGVRPSDPILSRTSLPRPLWVPGGGLSWGP